MRKELSREVYKGRTVVLYSQGHQIPGGQLETEYLVQITPVEAELAWQRGVNGKAVLSTARHLIDLRQI